MSGWPGSETITLARKANEPIEPKQCMTDPGVSIVISSLDDPPIVSRAYRRCAARPPRRARGKTRAGHAAGCRLPLSARWTTQRSVTQSLRQCQAWPGAARGAEVSVFHFCHWRLQNGASLTAPLANPEGYERGAPRAFDAWRRRSGKRFRMPWCATDRGVPFACSRLLAKKPSHGDKAALARHCVICGATPRIYFQWHRSTQRPPERAFWSRRVPRNPEGR
jgi:hypothetical protein